MPALAPSRRLAVARSVPTLLLIALAATLGGLLPSPALAVGPTVDEPLTVQRAMATPVTPSSPCSIEPEAPEFSNVDWTPFPHVLWFGATLIPSRDDVTADLRAGVNSDLCLGFSLPIDAASPSIANSRTLSDAIPVNPQTHATNGDDMRDIVIDLPRGFAGNLSNIGTCTEEQFGYDAFDETSPEDAPPTAYNPTTCPDAALVGDAMARMSTSAFNIHTTIGGSDVTSAPDPADDGYEPGAIWKLPSGDNELGRLGVQLYPDGLGSVKPTKFVVRLTLAPDGSGRVRAVVVNAPRQHVVSGTRNLYVEAVWMRMWGAAADHPGGLWQDPEYGFDYRALPLSGDFMESPTDCSAQASMRVDLTTYGGPQSADPSTWTPSRSQRDSPAVTMTGCAALPFAPSVTVEGVERKPSVPTGATVKVGFGQAAVDGRLPALPKDLSVTLPAGLELGAQVAAGADGLPLCTAAQFNVSQALVPNTCPAAAEAATVRIDSPLIDDPLVGKAYLGEQGAVGELPDLYLEVALAGATAADAPRVKLVGEVSVSDSGQVTTTFSQLPQLRFNLVTLTFPGGDNSLFVTPRACGTTTGATVATPWSGNPPTTVNASLTIDQNCDETGATSFAVTPSSAAAGAKAPTAVTLARSSDRAPWLSGVKVALPAGFLADLNVASECSSAQAAAASCPAESRIGTVKTKAGVGPDPLELDGAIFLTEREAGRVAGASMVVRAELGEVDLGDVIVPAVIDLRPTDAGLTLTTQVPQRFRGLALNLRDVTVDLDREGFALNPSACGPLPAIATLTPAGGEATDVSTQVAYTGCAERPFAPAITAEAIGENVAGGHPTLKVEIATRPGDSNLKSTSVLLPLGLSTDLKNVQVRCAPAAFEAGACEPAHRVGSVVASVSITNEQVPGDVYLVDVPGETLPGLGLSFTGRFAQRVSSTVRFVGDRLQTTFPAIPDLPLTKLSLTVDGGGRSPILRSVRCAATNSSWDSAFTGQGGQTHAATQATPCQGVPAVVKPTPKRATVKLTASRKKGLRLTVRELGDRKLQSVKLTAPKGKSFVTSALKKKGRVKATLTGAKVKTKVSKQSVTAEITGKTGASGASLTLDKRGSAVTTGKGPKKGAKASFKLRLAFTDGTTETKTIRIRLPR